MPTKTRELRAVPVVIERLRGDAGPCQMDCGERATFRVTWEIVGYGLVPAWYCDEHRPEGTHG